MKIIQIIPSLHGGGAEKFVIDLSNELSKNNELIICSLYSLNKDMFMMKDLNKNIRIITLNKKKGLDLKIFFKLYKLIKVEKPDIINTHLRALLYMLFIIIQQKYPILHTLHNLANKETNKINQYLYKIYFKIFKVTPIAISNEVLHSLKKVYGNEYNILIENGLKEKKITNKNDLVKEEIESYKINKNTKVFLNIGRISYQKNHLMLVEAFNELIEEGHNISLLIIGQDTTKEKLFENELKNTINKNIHLLGMKNNIIDYLYHSNFFCLSSRYEGLPITLLESLSMKTIPICTPAGGIPDVIDDNIGFLSPDFSKKSFKNTILFAIQTPKNKIIDMEEKCKLAYKNKYKIETTANNYMNVYKERK